MLEVLHLSCDGLKLQHQDIGKADLHPVLSVFI